MTLQEIRKEFFARRNGVVADRLRKAGDRHRYIMGCTLTEIMAVADTVPKSVSLARELWADKIHREARLLAPMVFPVAEFDKHSALQWIKDVENEEIADNLCHKLLRKCDFAAALADELLQQDNPELIKYTTLRLLMNLLMIGKHPALTAEQQVHIAQIGETATSLHLKSLCRELTNPNE